MGMVRRLRLVSFSLLLALFGSPAWSLADSLNADAASPPTLATPLNGATIDSLSTRLSWANPQGTTQLQVQLIPYNNDGPGMDVYFGMPVSGLTLPAPPQWYGMLPDMGYTWRVRTSNAPGSLALDHPSWSGWAQATFRTPKASTAGVALTAPAPSALGVAQPAVLQWSGPQEYFYYEVQLSSDPTFNTDPATASAAVYWVLVHGGMTVPANSYTLPAGASLQPETTYYWRVRPRVQGDGVPATWPAASSFATAPGGPLVGPPVFGTTASGGCSPASRDTQSQAMIPYGAQMLYARFDYTGSGPVRWAWYREGGQLTTWSDLSLSGPKGCGMVGVSNASGPLPSGAYRLDITFNQRLLQTRTVIIQ